MLNPYERTALLDGASQEERLRLDVVDRRTNFYSIRNFKVSYDRHKDAYGKRVTNFPTSYATSDSALEWANDPDAMTKFRQRRLNLKLILLGSFLTYHLIQWKCR